ncbi:pyrroloquinoline quinone biosynthesis protein PqqB [Roseitranquillus sediminis]|uniref:pyrroloquinoline quinone biosynthesis protein PqqB n=1 Tax=Roseitranquillus sediminis TaxID=2809051 RepID=UPI001D0C46D2|nr:pyrroloquinoline quinone biosynthesis protein PqqB [Roseitranquillus sediminis]MBM9595942.1 pyrroloquinoline quinone biosynthesis protein PqqB [Roseitranquillus sediminis]
MLTIVVLGTTAGGGLPQWNCNCPTCRAAWEDPQLRDTQASLALSADGENWFLVNASPDIRQQIIETPQLHPRADQLRHSPIAGVILTNGEVDAIAGLLTLREGSPFGIWAHTRVLETLEANNIFNVLDRERVPRRPIELGRPFEPVLQDGRPSGLVIEAFEVPGKPAWYLEETGTDEATGDTLGLYVHTRDGTGAYILTACGGVTPELAARLRGASAVFFDGTLWSDDEIVRAGLGRKTGQRMGHVSMSGESGAIAALADLEIDRKLFIHVNNSNPAHLPHSPERQELEAAGWEIPSPGQEVRL